MIRLGLVCDYLEEQWPSMDLVAAMVQTHLCRDWSDQVALALIRPPLVHRAGRIARGPGLGARHNLDRLLNRFHDYPRALQRIVRHGDHDLYHLIDHSYSQLVRVLPPGRSVVTCHDLDTFRCLLEPQREPRPRWFRAMARRILDGLAQAAAVVCVSNATREAIRAYDLIPDDCLHVVPNGISNEFTVVADAAGDAAATIMMGRSIADPDRSCDLLHVGSTIPRKRIDVLLDVFAAIHHARPETRLIKAGSPLTPEQWERACRLGVADAILTLPPLERPILAAVYRHAALVLQPSDAEGFGLPVAEALACGTPVLASDLPVLREVGGPAASYAPVADVPSWTETVLALLDERQHRPDAWKARRDLGITHAAQFRWSAHVARLVEIYRSVLA